MGNINLITSKNTDVLIDSEVKYLKSIGLRISKVDFVNYILEDIYSKEDDTSKYRDIVINIMKEQELEKEKRYEKLRGSSNV